MKYLDFSSLFEGEPAYIAFLSTFQFDPDFFERRLLRTPALMKARRIVLFVDARRWFDLLQQDVAARWLNRRYLVVPIHRAQGAFHPKLSLILTETGGQVICGSNNLTRSGCSSNLELLNVLPFDYEGETQEAMNVAREAFAFFAQASGHAADELRRITTDWIEDTAATFPWLRDPVQETNRSVRLLQTYDGDLWSRLVNHLDGLLPSEFLIVSPFHDADGELFGRIAGQWAHSKLEILVQQGYTCLDVKPLRKHRKLQLAELKDCSRRIHAKLFAWRSKRVCGCLVGSANFTTAAFDGRNVEACLLITEAEETLTRLFDRTLVKQHLDFDAFIPGDADLAHNDEQDLPVLRITSALLTDSNQLVVSYFHQIEPPPGDLRVTVRTPSETRPRASVGVPNKANVTVTVTLSDSVLADVNGTLLASLVADVHGEKLQSWPIWIVQERRLTYEPGETGSSSRGRIEDTGEGLPEYIDELGTRDGLGAVVDYLRHLNIRFQGGSHGGLGQRKFRLKLRDPFHADMAPEWLVEAKTKTDDLEQAIYDFVDRHIRKRLLKHTQQGNVNAMENFLDILTTLVRLIYIYFERGVVKKNKLIGSLCTCIELATLGKDTEKEAFDGYLYAVYNAVGGDVDVLQEACDEANYLGDVRAVLVVVQSVRFDLDEQPLYGRKALRPSETLPTYSKAVAEAIRECDLREPTLRQIQRALESYRMFTDAQIAELVSECDF